MITVIKTYLIFILAGLCEIGGGYLIWLWLKEEKSSWHGVIGALILVLYGVVATWQPSSFAKVYAAYGGIFIVLSLLWAYKFDDYIPTKYEVAGAIITLIGAAIIYYSPRQ